MWKNEKSVKPNKLKDIHVCDANHPAGCSVPMSQGHCTADMPGKCVQIVGPCVQTREHREPFRCPRHRGAHSIIITLLWKAQLSQRISNLYRTPKKHSSAPNLKSRIAATCRRTCDGSRQMWQYLLTVMARRKHRQCSVDITEITSHPRKLLL